MGGDYTQKVEQPVAKPTQSTAATTPVPGSIILEFQISNHEAHFHDRTNNLKVAVPVAKWYAAWDRLQSGGSARPLDWSHFDPVNMTHMVIETWCEANTNVRMVAFVTIRKVEPLDGTYEKLNAFFRDSKSAPKA